MKRKKNSEIRRLVLAKKLYLHGCSHASAKDKIGRMLAIHHFDNAIEIILKCIATEQDLRPKGKYFYFEELLRKIKDLCNGQFDGTHFNLLSYSFGDKPSSP